MNPNPNAHQTDAALDHLLEAHLASPAEQLTPSSGFALSVMDAIHQQASGPPPLAFPWRRVLPGAIAILCALVTLIVLAPTRTASHIAIPVVASGPRIHLFAPSSFTYGEVVLCSFFLAACITTVAVAASFRLAGRSR